MSMVPTSLALSLERENKQLRAKIQTMEALIKDVIDEFSPDHPGDRAACFECELIARARELV